MSVGAPTVLRLLRVAQLRIAVLALLVVGVVLALGTGFMMKVSAQRNLELQARSVSYAIEAAAMFQDASAADALLNEMLSREPVVHAWVQLSKSVGGSHTEAGFASYVKPGARARWEAALLQVWPMYASASVTAHGQRIGEVRLQADASLLLQLFGWLLFGVVTGMLLTGIAVMQISRSLSDRLVLPLQALAMHTRQVRALRALERRAPRAGVYEIDQLSADFDALLEEIEGHQFELLQRHDELKSAHEQLSDRVRKDALTGAVTRAHFEDCLDAAISQAERDDEQFALLFVDADRFKAINDQHGHDAGDQVLIALVERLKDAVREQDLVGRLGGDEFVVLMRSLRPPMDKHHLIEQLTRAVSIPLTLHNGVTVIPGISVGVAIYPDHSRTAIGLMKAADQAMYSRKRATGAEAARSDVQKLIGTASNISR